MSAAGASDKAAFASWPKRLLALRNALACPTCRGDLDCEETRLTCKTCGTVYPVQDGQIRFISPMGADDPLDKLKHRLKHWLGGAYYTVGVAIIAPTYPFNFRKAIYRHFDPSRQSIVDLGCGANRVDDAIVTLDVVAYDAVDIVADLAQLPFKSDSIDGFVSRSVLEHLPDFPAATNELMRCTRPGGKGLHLIPFLFPYHASPNDFQRLTHSGAERLFNGWSLVEQKNATGPVTLFVVCLAEFLAIVLSLGVKRLKGPAYLLACVLLFPIKFLDMPFVGRKAFLSLAPSILTVTRKP